MAGILATHLERGSYLQFTQLTLGSASPRFGPVRVRLGPVVARVEDPKGSLEFVNGWISQTLWVGSKYLPSGNLT